MRKLPSKFMRIVEPWTGVSHLNNTEVSSEPSLVSEIISCVGGGRREEGEPPAGSV